MSYSEEDEYQSSKRKEFVIALVYSVILVVCGAVIQRLVQSYLESTSVAVSALAVAALTFIVSMVFTSIAKGILKDAVGEHMMDRNFVLYACILILICSILCFKFLMFWWVTAISGIFGTLVAAAKLVFKKHVKKTVREVRAVTKDARQLEHDLRHQSIDYAKEKKDELKDLLRGKR